MFLGLPNPNLVIPLKKMVITAENRKGKPFTVLYNPQSYVQSKSVKYRMIPEMGADAPLMQFRHGEAETISFELFFDAVSSGTEVSGGLARRAKFAANALLPTATGIVDIREYTDEIAQLAHVDDDLHRPPILKINWGDLDYQCLMTKCEQVFTKFNESGKPVRARLNCTFTQLLFVDELFSKHPLHSPDTTKYRTVRQGDSLWSIASDAYGDVSQWRAIANANGIQNPRKLYSGDLLAIPALK